MKSKYKKIIIPIATLALIMLLMFLCIFFLPNNKYMDIFKAYKISKDVSHNWNRSSLLVSISSADKEGFNNTTYGSNGRREFWNVEYAVPNTDEHLIIEIIDGKIIKYTLIQKMQLKML